MIGNTDSMIRRDRANLCGPGRCTGSRELVGVHRDGKTKLAGFVNIALCLRDRKVIFFNEDIDSLSELVNDLMVFARPRAPRPTDLRLRPLVTEAITMVRRDPA